MLLEFKTKNYKSFVEEITFSLIPAPKQKGLDYSVLRAHVGKQQYKALCTAVVYGPNASGKTNLLGAMDVFKAIVQRGHIRNVDGEVGPNMAISRLELIPNMNAAEGAHTKFSVTFIEQGMLFEYELVLDLGCFLANDYQREIIFERLAINNKTIFSRKNTQLQFGDLASVKKYWANGLEHSIEEISSFAQNNVNAEELF
ncbi:MAG: AAA family ATPase, partial [Bacilli bacterium]